MFLPGGFTTCLLNNNALELRLIIKKSFRQPNCRKDSKVRPWGVEPQSMEPESIILSIELRAHLDFSMQNYKTYLELTSFFCRFCEFIIEFIIVSFNIFNPR